MLHNFASLNEEEQKVFHFIHKHTDMIEELKILFNGVTTQIFILPPVTKINKKTERVGFSVKTALENVFLTGLKQWRDNHLTENMAVAGRKILLSA